MKAINYKDFPIVKQILLNIKVCKVLLVLLKVAPINKQCKPSIADKLVDSLILRKFK